MARSVEVLTYIELSLRMRDMSMALEAALASRDDMSEDFRSNLDSMVRRMASVKDSLGELEEIASL